MNEIVDLLKEGSNWLEDERAKFLSQKAVYTTSAGDIISITGTLGRSIYQYSDEYAGGITIEASAVDFIVLTEDLKKNGALIKPLHGDHIILAGINYEVLNLPGESCWRYSDSYGKAIRIHIKRIDL